MSLPLKVIHIISGLGHGGAETVLLRLVTHDSVNTHQVLVMQAGGVMQAQFEVAGIRVDCLNMPVGKIRWADILRMKAYLKQEAPDVVQTWMYHADLFGGLAARLAGIKRVFWGIRNSGRDLKKSSRTSYWIARYLGWTSYFIPKKIVCCAQLAKDQHARYGYASSKMVVIQNGYDLNQWQYRPEQRSVIRQSLGLPENAPVIGTVARFNPLKDHKNLLHALQLALKKNPTIRCVLVGEGLESSNTTLMGYIEQYQLHDHVLLLGRRDDVPQLMQALDIHVLSSLAEGFPNVVAEAMASGVPCVVTNVGDAALIVDRYGWVVPPQDPPALAQAIINALEAVQQGINKQLPQECRHYVLDHFSVDKMVAAYSALWHEA